MSICEGRFKINKIKKYFIGIVIKHAYRFFPKLTV